MRRTGIIVTVVALALAAGCNGGSAQSESFHNDTFPWAPIFVRATM